MSARGIVKDRARQKEYAADAKLFYGTGRVPCKCTHSNEYHYEDDFKRGVCQHPNCDCKAYVPQEVANG